MAFAGSLAFGIWMQRLPSDDHDVFPDQQMFDSLGLAKVVLYPRQKETIQYASNTSLYSTIG